MPGRSFSVVPARASIAAGCSAPASPLPPAAAALGEDNEICFRRGATESASACSRKWRQLRKAKELLPEIGRFQLCHDAVAHRAHQIGIHKRGGTAWYRGLIRCGSVWICPICARRIAEGRREELQGAIDAAVSQGLGVILVTLTFPHGAGDALGDILERFTKAQRYFKGGRAAKALRARIGFAGEVRTLEVTHGQNGWHPHAHSLWFTARPLKQDEQEQLIEELYVAWRRACLNAGLPEPSRAHGVDVRGARYAGEYVAKWGFAMELAGAPAKRGVQGSRTPWELLADATEGDHRAAVLWRTFALSFAGKRQLYWSRGLRDRIGVGAELTEQMLLDIQDVERSQQVLTMDLDTWYVVRKVGAQSVVLDLAVQDVRALKAYLNELRSTVPMEHGKPPGPREDWVS